MQMINENGIVLIIQFWWNFYYFLCAVLKILLYFHIEADLANSKELNFNVTLFSFFKYIYNQTLAYLISTAGVNTEILKWNKEILLQCNGTLSFPRACSVITYYTALFKQFYL